MNFMMHSSLVSIPGMSNAALLVKLAAIKVHPSPFHHPRFAWVGCFRHAACGGEGERSLGECKPPPGAAPLDPLSKKPTQTVEKLFALMGLTHCAYFIHDEIGKYFF
jgi:hypothetical protein